MKKIIKRITNKIINRMNNRKNARSLFEVGITIFVAMLFVNMIIDGDLNASEWTLIDYIETAISIICGFTLAWAYMFALDRKDEVYFAKTNSSASIPSKKDEDAGYDIYACFNEEDMIINPHETVMIPTGICSAFDSKYVMLLHERGSTGTKGIGQRAGVIDSGYRGEWMIPLTNHNTKPIIITKVSDDEVLHALRRDYIIYPYHKALCQALLVPVPKVDIVEKTLDEVMSISSERGHGKLGSSGK